jgi:hypothetical protein
MVNDDHIDRCFGRLQPQPELLFECREQIRRRIGIVGRRYRITRGCPNRPI